MSFNPRVRGSIVVSPIQEEIESKRKGYGERGKEGGGEHKPILKAK